MSHVDAYHLQSLCTTAVLVLDWFSSFDTGCAAKTLQKAALNEELVTTLSECSGRNKMLPAKKKALTQD
jgi:hypothetical protein